MRQFSTKAFGLFHRIFAAGLSPRGLRLELRLTLAALLLAAATLGGVFFGVAQAQEANGAITGLALSSDSPGTLVISWDMPSPAPSDYRVDWAKSGESYQSYKVDEGHVYPEGSATTVTITDLEAGTEYKVRMRARYNQGEHADSPWSGPWQEASLTVAAEPTPEPTAEPTEEPEDGAIGSPTATDDNAGRLVIAWQAPQAPHDAPTDYRVSWARSDDDYPSYTEEHGNAHPATTTHTLEGLDRDTEYKIRIRARYSPNGQYDAHWSGPWTEITALVVSSPPDTRKNSGAPAAPTLIGTAVTPEGHVTLLWLDPSDDSITGYRVLRGPDADSLAAIREDTGSTAVSYTDTEAEAGQTYTYAVEARNAAGLSPLSKTRTATVPQNEEEEEPVAVRQETVTTLVSNLGNTATGVLPINPDTRAATSFTIDAGPLQYTLSALHLRASKHLATAAAANPKVTVHRDDGGQPGALLYTLADPSGFLSADDIVVRQYTFTAPEGATLDPGATYWVVFHTDSDNYRVESTSETTETGEGWTIGDESLGKTGANDWASSVRGPAKFAVLGLQQEGATTLVSNLGNTATGVLPINPDTRAATSFTIDAGPLQYTLSTLHLRVSKHLATAAAANPKVTVHRDDGGQPGALLYTLADPSGFLSADDIVVRQYTFTAPEGATLDPAPPTGSCFILTPTTTVSSLHLKRRRPERGGRSAMRVWARLVLMIGPQACVDPPSSRSSVCNRRVPRR